MPRSRMRLTIGWTMVLIAVLAVLIRRWERSLPHFRTIVFTGASATMPPVQFNGRNPKHVADINDLFKALNERGITYRVE